EFGRLAIRALLFCAVCSACLVRPIPTGGSARGALAPGRRGRPGGVPARSRKTVSKHGGQKHLVVMLRPEKVLYRKNEAIRVWFTKLNGGSGCFRLGAGEDTLIVYDAKGRRVR